MPPPGSTHPPPQTISAPLRRALRKNPSKQIQTSRLHDTTARSSWTHLPEGMFIVRVHPANGYLPCLSSIRCLSRNRCFSSKRSTTLQRHSDLQCHSHNTTSSPPKQEPSPARITPQRSLHLGSPCSTCLGIQDPSHFLKLLRRARFLFLDFRLLRE